MDRTFRPGVTGRPVMRFSFITLPARRTLQPSKETRANESEKDSRSRVPDCSVGPGVQPAGGSFRGLGKLDDQTKDDPHESRWARKQRARPAPAQARGAAQVSVGG